MGDTYHFGIKGYIVHITHILIGLWLIYIGYEKIKEREIYEYNYYGLTILGIILLLYFLIVSYKEWGNRWNYAFGVPNYVIFTTHLINSLLFIGIGMKYIDIGEIMSMYLIVSGVLAAAYHGHLMIIKH
tara:strand:- start:120 stop:506 length:387 start_codon:yes stop_codon:yes gene_type:complete